MTRFFCVKSILQDRTLPDFSCLDYVCYVKFLFWLKCVYWRHFSVYFSSICCIWLFLPPFLRPLFNLWLVASYWHFCCTYVHIQGSSGSSTFLPFSNIISRVISQIFHACISGFGYTDHLCMDVSCLLCPFMYGYYTIIPHVDVIFDILAILGYMLQWFSVFS